MEIVSLCSGYGGLDRAVEKITGYNVIAHAEILPEAIAVLKNACPDVPNLGDVTKMGWYEFAVNHPQVTVVCAGFPCQDISAGGFRAGITGDKSKVWFDVLKAVEAIRPELVFLENVSAIRTNGLDVVEQGLLDADYSMFWTVIRASAVGAPHPRDRWFAVAVPQLVSGQFRSVTIARFSNDVVPKGVFGTPMVNSHSGPGDTYNYKNQSRLETQVVTGPDNPMWVDKSGAVQLWESITGPAPEPTTPNGSVSGKQLSPLFVEWMMGVEKGLVTSTPGLTRQQMITVLGGGVVPLQAYTAYKRLMTEIEVFTMVARGERLYPPELEHGPTVVEVDGNRFQCACRCGYPGKSVTSSPSHAYNATAVHADTANRGGPTPPAVGSSRPRTGSPRASRSTRGAEPTPCGCGCGEPSGGLFRPGHDSKLLSRLITAIRAGSITLADAHAEMTTIGTSDVLKDKLARKVTQ